VPVILLFLPSPAVTCEHKDVTELLLQRGIDVTLTDCDGCTAMDVACDEMKHIIQGYMPLKLSPLLWVVICCINCVPCCINCVPSCIACVPCITFCIPHCELFGGKREAVSNCMLKEISRFFKYFVEEKVLEENFLIVFAGRWDFFNSRFGGEIKVILIVFGGGIKVILIVFGGGIKVILIVFGGEIKVILIVFVAKKVILIAFVGK
jgi:hypothetical protein